MHKGLEIWLHHLGDKGELNLFAFGKHRSAECMTGRIGIKDIKLFLPKSFSTSLNFIKLQD